MAICDLALKLAKLRTVRLGDPTHFSSSVCPLRSASVCHWCALPTKASCPGHAKGAEGLSNAQLHSLFPISHQRKCMVSFMVPLHSGSPFSESFTNLLLFITHISTSYKLCPLNCFRVYVFLPAYMDMHHVLSEVKEARRGCWIP